MSLSLPPISTVVAKSSAQLPLATEERARLEQLEQENQLLRQEIDRLSTYRRLAYRDDLTGLYNRRHFEERLMQEWSRSRRSGDPLTVVVIDLDDFKLINDCGGHAAGDFVLAWFGGLFAKNCRDYDVACRVGGDELAYILPGTHAIGAEAVMRRLVELVASDEQTPVLPDGRKIGFSFGMATGPGEARDADELLRAADEAMYVHKRMRKAASADTAAA